jgi:CheY-like chemotaxis protein
MSGPKVKLLIVDDEPATRTLLTQIFGQMGHSVRSAADGFSALEQIREAMPDVLLSDLNMPGMSGFELLSVVRRRLPGIYVIATSGAYSGEEVPEGIAADAFYEKATNFRSLVNLMSAATEAVGTPARKMGPKAPLWIPRVGDDSTSDTYVMISCPECLRAFPQLFRSSTLLINETKCASCETPIQFAIVEPLDPATSQPYHPKLVAALATPVAA